MAKGMSFKVLLELQSKEFQKGINSIKKQLQGFGRFIKSAFALGSITMFGKQMVQVGKDFEDAMARVQAVSNATTEEFKKMQAEAQKLGSTTRYTATEAAGALENLTRNGMTAAQATKALSDVLKLAQANSIDLASAADILTNTLNMFNLSVDQAGRVNDVLSSTASHAATDITSLYEAMVNAAPAANVLGFSIEEVSSAIGALANRGVKGSEAGTKLRIAFQKMADPKVIAKMKEQGIEIDENTMKSEGLLKTVEKLSKANLSLGQLGKIFDAKSAMAVQQLVASLGDLQDMLEITANSAGETERMFNQSVGSVQKELDSLKSMYEGLLISISQKTSGVVKSVVRLLQNLIINFETVGGTIMNIASVAVPLFASRVVQLATSIRAAMQSAAAGIATLKASIGGIISLVATLVTWVGTALVGAWNRAHKEMKEANEQMSRARKEAIDTNRELEKLKDMIGDGSNMNSVNGAVARACQMFPEFADAIKDAAAAAASTENGWQRLKDLLQDIANLQEAVATRDAKKAVANASIKQYGHDLYLESRGVNKFYNMDKNSATDALYTIRKTLKDSGFDKDTRKEIFNGLAEVLIQSRKDTQDKRVDLVVKYLSDYNVELDPEDVLKIVNRKSSWSNVVGSEKHKNMAEENLTESEKADSAYVVTAVETAMKVFQKNEEDNRKLLEEKKITESQFAEKMYKASEALKKTVIEAGDVSEETWDKILDATSKYPKPKTSTNTPVGGDSGGNESTKETKTPSDYISEAIKDYNEAKLKLDNRLAAGTITTKDYEKELDNLEDKTWETITAFSDFESILEKLGQAALGIDLKGKYAQNRTDETVNKAMSQFGNLAAYTVPKETERPTKNDYSKTDKDILEETVKLKFEYKEGIEQLVKKLQSELEAGDFELVKEEAIEMLERLKTAAQEASEEADTLQAKLNLSEAISKIDDEIKNLNVSSWNTFNTLADTMDRLTSSLMSIAEVFDEDLKDSEFYKAFQAFNSVLNSSIQIMQTVASVIQLVREAQAKATLSKVKNTAMEVAANKAATASEMEKASAAAGTAVAAGAASVASVPYIGPVLAAAAALSIAAAIAAAMSKFATGGIVGGDSYSGDKNVVRVNSGEMILTKAQQRTLFDIANGKEGGFGGHVDFKIRGADLVGAIENYNSRRKG